jgi:adenylate cyclase
VTESEKNIIDMLLSKSKETVVDSSTLIDNVQKRIEESLENGFKSSGIVSSSEIFLRKHTFKHVEISVLYVDLVGSTKMSLELPSDKLSTLVSSFVQEMSYVISQNNGYVLKFSGDAVIGYFVGRGSALQACDSAVGCAESMLKIVENGINPILKQKSDLPQLKIKIGIDYGENTVVQFGKEENSFVDLLGPPMNMAAKVQGVAKPNQIVIGHDVYEKLHPEIQKMFYEITDKLENWSFTEKKSTQIYRVYAYKK